MSPLYVSFNPTMTIHPPNYKAVIFDLDGTLINSISDIAFCANSVLQNHGYAPLPTARYKELVGDGISNLVRKIMPDREISPEQLSELIEEYRKLYSANWNKETSIYAGIPELLGKLISNGFKIAVLSNKRDEFTKKCVSWFFPNTQFAEVRGERAGTPIKPAPDAALEIAKQLNVAPSECIFVGDSEIDIETAKRAGMKAVGVLWGFRPREILERAGADVIIGEPGEF